MADTGDVTGRDAYIISKAMAIALPIWQAESPPEDAAEDLEYLIALALYTALEEMQSWPEANRPWSDEQDMKDILNARFPDFVKAALVADPKAVDLISEKAPSGKTH